MKFGIATFNNALSYGAMMQAYALRKTLEKMGHESALLDYVCPGNTPSRDLKDLRQSLNEKKENKRKHFLRLMRFELYEKKALLKKVNGFKAFRAHYLNISAVEDQTLQTFDAVVCGSDQIWNPQITEGFFDPFFGINTCALPAMSYAASVGDVRLIQAYDESLFLEKVGNLKSVACREEELTAYLRSAGMNAETVLDPTLLLEASDYEELLEDGALQDRDEDYLFVFRLGKPQYTKPIAKKIAKKHHLKVVTLCGSYIPFPFSKNEFGDSAPQAYIELIKRAKYVVTDSFHGLALSIVFHKDFNVVLPQLRSKRLENLLSLVNLENRIVREKGDWTDGAVDYAEVDRRLYEEREKSYEYLKRGIERINECL